MSRRNLSKQPKFIHPAAKSRWKGAKRGTWTSTSRNRQLPPPIPEPEHDNPSTPQMDTPPMTTPETREEEEIDMNNTDIADLANVDYDIPTDADVFREAEREQQEQQPTRHIIGGQDLVNFMYNDFIPAMEKIYKFREELEQQVIPGLEEVSSTLLRIIREHQDG